MHIGKFQVLNFKTYRDSNEIEFKTRCSTSLPAKIVPKKTALLEAMTLQFAASPTSSQPSHRTDSRDRAPTGFGRTRHFYLAANISGSLRTRLVLTFPVLETKSAA